MQFGEGEGEGREVFGPQDAAGFVRFALGGRLASKLALVTLARGRGCWLEREFSEPVALRRVARGD